MPKSNCLENHPRCRWTGVEKFRTCYTTLYGGGGPLFLIVQGLDISFPGFFLDSQSDHELL